VGESLLLRLSKLQILHETQHAAHVQRFARNLCISGVGSLWSLQTLSCTDSTSLRKCGWPLADPAPEDSRSVVTCKGTSPQSSKLYQQHRIRDSRSRGNVSHGMDKHIVAPAPAEIGGALINCHLPSHSICTTSRIVVDMRATTLVVQAM
jgi:hypothetical protein